MEKLSTRGQSAASWKVSLSTTGGREENAARKRYQRKADTISMVDLTMLSLQKWGTCAAVFIAFVVRALGSLRPSLRYIGP